MSKHTEAGHIESKLSVYKNDAGIRLIDEDGDFICKMGSRFSPYTDKANAARLVKCWNMHDDLIDMIKKLKGELENSQSYNYEGDAYKQIENAEKLIKQSEQ